MLEFPGGRGIGGLGNGGSVLEKYVGNVGGVWEKGYMNLKAYLSNKVIYISTKHV